MKSKKSKFSWIFIAVSIGIVTLLILVGIKIFSYSTLEYSEFCEIIKLGSSSQLSLTIYYMTPTHTFNRYNESDLEEDYSYKIKANKEFLHIYADILNEMSEIQLIPTEYWLMDARWSLVFKHKNLRKELRITMNGIGKSMYVNGVEFEQSRVFVEFLVTFLPMKDAQEILEALEYYYYELDRWAYEDEWEE